MKKVTILLVLVAMLVTPALAQAESPWVQEETYGDKVSGKLQFGLTNVLLGWTDLFIEPIRGAQGCKECENVWTGIGKGITDSILNEVGGALHLVTFPLVLDIPLPDDGVQLKGCCGTGCSTGVKG